MQALPLTSAGDLVGREHELAALRVRLDAANAGSAGIVLLAGEPGIGKTRLAEELAGEARGRGCHLLWGRAWDGEGAPVFWPWVQVIRALVRGRDPSALRDELGAGAAPIAQLVAEVHERLPDLAPPPSLEPAQARFRLFESIATFLGNAARDRTLVLILDDLHAADVPSLLLLRFLAQALGVGPCDGAAAPRILIIGTYRDVDVGREHPLLQTLAELAREQHVQRIDLRGLGDEDVARCIAGVTGRIPPPSLAATIARATNGNPFFITEMARLLVPADATLQDAGAISTVGLHEPTARPLGSPAWDFGIPPSVRTVIAHRLERLSAPCNQVLTIAAVIGQQFTLGTLSTAGESLTEPLLDALEEAESARLIAAGPGMPGYYHFAHALIREVVYESLPTARRIRLHHKVALALQAQWGADASDHLAELAHHFVQAAPAADLERAVAYARRAGDHALSMLAHEEAVRLYEMALTTRQAVHVVDERSRCELLLALGDARTRAGDFGAARVSFEQAIASARRLPVHEERQSTALLAHAVLGISMAADTGRADAALVALLEEAAAALSAEESALRARVLARSAVALIMTDGTEERRATLARDAVAMARRAADRLAVASTLHAWLVAAWEPEDVTERLAAATEVARLAEEAGDGGLAFRGHGRRLAALLELGDLIAADVEIEACARLAAELRQPHYHWSIAVMRAMRTLLAGRLEEGERLIQEALTLGTRAQSSDAFGAFGAQLLLLRRDQGRLAELAPLLSRFIAQFPKVTAFRGAAALLYAELGQDDEARQEFERLAVDRFAGVPRAEGWLVTIVNLAEVCASLGDTTRAAILLDLLRPYAGRCVVVGMGIGFGGAASHYLGLLSATLGRLEEAAAYFAGALALHRRMGARAHLARTAAAYAAIVIAGARAERGVTLGSAVLPDLRLARELLLEARAVARELEMARVLEESERLLAELDAPVRDVARSPLSLPVLPGPSYPGRLTAREAEVLHLLSTGATNQEIADTLVVSVRTVERHLLHIYGKIGARRRADAVAYALRQGAA